jgi:UDP-glucose 4-epimerase
MRNVLVTGGMGFIGTAVARRFAATDNVTVADRLDFGLSPLVESLCATGRARFIETDLSEVSSLHERVREGEFEVIVHLASLTHIPFCELYPHVAYQSNVISALNLISRISPECRFVNFSTSSVYAPETRPHREMASPLSPCDFYGWTKKHVEDLAQYYAERNGLRILNIRPANAAGFGETNVKLLGTIFQQLQGGKPYLELGSLTPRRDFIHVDDIAGVIARLVDLWPIGPGCVETFNVGTGYEPISVEETVRKIIALAGRPVEIRSVQARRRRMERELLAVDVTKLRRAIPDYQPLRIDDWLPALVKDPGLRVTNHLETRLRTRTRGA